MFKKTPLGFLEDMSSDTGLHSDQSLFGNDYTDINWHMSHGLEYQNAHQVHNVLIILVPGVCFSYPAVPSLSISASAYTV